MHIFVKYIHTLINGNPQGALLAVREFRFKRLQIVYNTYFINIYTTNSRRIYTKTIIMAAVQFITTCFSQRVASPVFSRALHLD